MGLTFFGQGKVFVWGGYMEGICVGRVYNDGGRVEKRAFQKFGMGIKARRADGNPSLW